MICSIALYINWVMYAYVISLITSATQRQFRQRAKHHLTVLRRLWYVIEVMSLISGTGNLFVVSNSQYRTCWMSSPFCGRMSPHISSCSMYDADKWSLWLLLPIGCAHVAWTTSDIRQNNAVVVIETGTIVAVWSCLLLRMRSLLRSIFFFRWVSVFGKSLRECDMSQSLFDPAQLWIPERRKVIINHILHAQNYKETSKHVVLHSAHKWDLNCKTISLLAKC